MHPAPSLAEAFPKTNTTNDRAQYDSRRIELGPRHQQSHPQESLSNHINHASDQPRTIVSPIEHRSSLSPIERSPEHLTASSLTELTTSDQARTGETAANGFSAESSQSIFSVKDGVEIMQNRRASRRRTGPLSAQQREKAALIRKLGACIDCRRRRVACHPNHHNMTWEDAIRKYRSASPLQDLSPPARHRSGSVIHRRKSSTESQPMDIESITTPTKLHVAPAPPRLSLGDTRVRTPLPSAPRLEKAISMPPIVAAPPMLSPSSRLSSFGATLEKSVSSLLSPVRSHRYAMTHALMITWEDDTNAAVQTAVNELGTLLRDSYDCKLEIVKIPLADADTCKSPSRWLSRLVDDFTEKHDSWDCLKIVYYCGYSFLDHDRNMVLASSHSQAAASTIRWDGIQQKLEEACSDTLVLMDAAYYPASRMVRQKGVLEMIAASTTQEYFRGLERASFSRLLLHQLSPRSIQRYPHSLSVTELYSRLLFSYPKMMQDQHVDKGLLQSGLLWPLHVQASSTSTVPSITLTPTDSVQLPPMSAPPYLHRSNSNYESDHHDKQVSLTFRVADTAALNVESWRQWLMMMPEGIKSVKVDDSQLRV